MAKDLMNNKIQSKLDIKMTEKYCPKEMAAAIRALSMDAVEEANSGHPGAPMGMADIAKPYGLTTLNSIQRTPNGLIVIDLSFQMDMVRCCYTRFAFSWL